MADSESFPVIVNVDPSAQDPQLIGLTITDHRPLGDALTALGVPETELADWKVYSDRPSANFKPEPREVVIRPWQISRQMRSIAGLGADSKRKYVESFNKAASGVILSQLALGVARTHEPNKLQNLFSKKVPGTGTPLPTISAYGVGILGTAFGTGELILGVPAGIAAAVCTSGLGRYLTSPARTAKKLVKQAESANPHLATSLEKVVLPLYRH